MKRYANITPDGSRDFLFDESDDRKNVESALSALYKERGYRRVITPAIEYFDVFSNGNSGIEADDMYKLTDNYGRTTVLRPDNTMPQQGLRTRIFRCVFFITKIFLLKTRCSRAERMRFPKAE